MKEESNGSPKTRSPSKRKGEELNPSALRQKKLCHQPAPMNDGSPPPELLIKRLPKSPVSPYAKFQPKGETPIPLFKSEVAKSDRVDEGGPADMPLADTPASKAPVPVGEAQSMEQLYSKALDHLRQVKVVSAVSLRKKLGISYTIAEKIIKEMQRKGAIKANVEKPRPSAVKVMHDDYIERYDKTLTTLVKISDEDLQEFISRLQHRKFLSLIEDFLLMCHDRELEDAVRELNCASIQGAGIQIYFNIAKRLQVVNDMLQIMCDYWPPKIYSSAVELLKKATAAGHLTWAEFALLAGANLNDPYASSAIQKASESKDMRNLFMRYCPEDFKQYLRMTFDKVVAAQKEKSPVSSEELRTSSAASFRKHKGPTLASKRTGLEPGPSLTNDR